MRSVNKVTLLGNITKDANTAFTPSGTACTKFSMATNRRWKDKQSGEWKDEADFHNVVLWNSENVSNYLLKGKPIYVEGRISTRSYEKDGEKKYITEIIADNVILVGGGEKQEQSAPKRRAQSDSAGLGVTDSDVPW